MLPSAEFRENYSLLKNNTFHIDVNARYYTEISTINQLRGMISSGVLKNQRFLLLGGGSNVLFTGNFEGRVAHISNKGIEITAKEKDTVLVKAAAGENWHEFVTYCVVNGFGGVENLSLIPGNVGSSPIQNIGAYGAEIKDTLHSLEAIDLTTGELKTYTCAECKFGYRDSIFKRDLKGKVAIWSVTFRLSLNPVINIGYGAIQQELAAMGIKHPGIADVSRAICAIRQSKLPDPEVLGNAGSFFKNPTVDEDFANNLKKTFPKMVSFPQENQKVKLAAGWLIEQCGWKGYREGDAGVHEQQALVLVNYGNATGTQIINLAKKVQNSVHEQFGIQLEMEVNVI